MFAQMFPVMEWIPVILLVIAVVVFCVVVSGSILVSRLVPLKGVRPEVARNVRRGLAAVIAVIAVLILLLACRSCAPLGGPDPRQRVALGMSAEEARGLLGKPHEQLTDAEGNESWIYYRDWAGMGYYLVRFDRDGRVYEQWLE
jgi:hypothetical protein